MAGLCRIARTEVSRLWSSRLPRFYFAIFSWGVTMQSQRACWSTEAQAVFVRFPHARRCCAAVAALSRDLLYVARGEVGFRVWYLIQLRTRRVRYQSSTSNLLELSLLASILLEGMHMARARTHTRPPSSLLLAEILRYVQERTLPRRAVIQRLIPLYY